MKTTVKILRNDHAYPVGKLADAEVHFIGGDLDGNVESSRITRRVSRVKRSPRSCGNRPVWPRCARPGAPADSRAWSPLTEPLYQWPKALEPSFELRP